MPFSLFKAHYEFHLHIKQPGSKFWPTEPQFFGEIECELCPGFRARNEELKGSGFLGTEGNNSPFRGATPKLTVYSDFPYPKCHSSHFLEHPGIFGRIHGPEPVSGRNSSPDPGRNTVCKILSHLVKHCGPGANTRRDKRQMVKLTFLTCQTQLRMFSF